MSAEGHKPTDIHVSVQYQGESTSSVTLSATASTSSVELITKNNQQSETTTFRQGPAKGFDLGISRFEEVAGSGAKGSRSFELIVKNFAAEKAVDAKLLVMIPSLLKFGSANPADKCQYDEDSGSLSCDLEALEPVGEGGEAVTIVFYAS